MNLGIGKLRNYLEMECRKIKFENWKSEKLFYQKIKFQKLETRKIIEDGMSEN